MPCIFSIGADSPVVHVELLPGHYDTFCKRAKRAEGTPVRLPKDCKKVDGCNLTTDW